MTTAAVGGISRSSARSSTSGRRGDPLQRSIAEILRTGGRLAGRPVRVRYIATPVAGAGPIRKIGDRAEYTGSYKPGGERAGSGLAPVAACPCRDCNAPYLRNTQSRTRTGPGQETRDSPNPGPEPAPGAAVHSTDLPKHEAVAQARPALLLRPQRKTRPGGRRRRSRPGPGLCRTALVADPGERIAAPDGWYPRADDCGRVFGLGLGGFERPTLGCLGMRMRGLEPPQSYLHTDLNRARLPIPPHPRATGPRR